MRVDETFAVLTCDIIRSRKFNYPKLLNVVNENILRLKKRFGNIFYAGPELVFGDSIQMVIIEPGLSLNVFNEFEEYLWLAGKESLGEPIKIRCGIGIGSIVGGKDKIGEMSGEAFLNARRALESTKKHHKWSIAAYDCGIDNVWTEFLASIAEITSALKSNWTYRQRQVIKMRRENIKSIEIAKSLGIRPQTVTTIIRPTFVEKIFQIENTTALAIHRLIQRGEIPSVV